MFAVMGVTGQVGGAIARQLLVTSKKVRAIVRDSAGEFTCHSRRHDWRGAIRELTQMLVSRLHQQWIMRSAVAA